MRLDRFISNFDEVKKTREVKEGVEVDGRVFLGFIRYIIKVDGYYSPLFFRIHNDQLNLRYMSNDRTWLACLDLSIKNYENYDAEFRVEIYDLSEVLTQYYSNRITLRIDSDGVSETLVIGDNSIQINS